ncbi:MAG: hypothetical protein QOF67_2662 [Mycobacterium sp.]|jgi:hypothetical protein|nr:hypothetical protein [Mycobacterium sp.]
MRCTKLTIALATAGTGAICLAPVATADVTTSPSGPTAPSILSPKLHLNLLPPDPIRSLVPPDPVRLNVSPTINLATGAPNLDITPCIRVAAPAAPNLDITPCIKVGSVDVKPTVNTNDGSGVDTHG